MNGTLRFATQALIVGLTAHVSLAQAPAGSEQLTQAAVAESLVVLKKLDSVVRARPNDATAWYHRGVLAWALYARDRTPPPIAGLDWTQLGHMADTSLRRAAFGDPDNAEYRMMVGRFLLNSGISITRLASYQMFTSALDKARRSSDPHIHAEAALEVGRLHWRRYDTYENRWPGLGGSCGFLNAETQDVGLDQQHAPKRLNVQVAMREDIQRCKEGMSMRNTDFPGEADYIESEAYFREAFDAQPSFERAYRQLAMLLVDRNRWRELEVTARTRLAASPDDAWAWLTLGLSMHRQRSDPHAVAAAFDSALARLAPEDAQRLDRLERVLRPQDTLRTAALDQAAHSVVQRFYWQSSDPLWAREGDEPRTEFLARVTYAELRWTAEEMHVRGADTDRGDTHIRYGPPNLNVVVTAGQFVLMTDWVYENGLIFRFQGMATFATAMVPPQDQLGLGENQGLLPASWDNIREIVVDSMPAQAARFRTGSDSVDLYIATLPPIAQIRKSADVAGRVRADFWLFANLVDPVSHDTTAIDASGVRAIQKRLPPGNYIYRVEASADGARYAARAAGSVIAGTDTATGFRARGFGMSDVLLAASASSRGPARRWTDLTLDPLVGTTVRKGRIALVWEDYELGNDRGTARYSVAISVERQRSLAGRIAAQIIGRVGGAIGVDRTEDRITSHYERAVPYAPALLDNIALALGDTPAGSYRVTVTIVDHVTGETTARGLGLTVAEK